MTTPQQPSPPLEQQPAAEGTQKVVLGLLGGSGLSEMPGLVIKEQHAIDTPFGKPSAPVRQALLGERECFFLPRHGEGHTLTPSEVNYRANIFALKSLGVTHLLAVSAVGIMRETIKPGDLVVPDQIFDRTKGIRKSSFFGEGIVGHVQMADPFCQELRQCLEQAAEDIHDTQVHHGGAYVCMEGPAFSTRAESQFYRNTLNPAVIGMTGVPEAQLAREAELCYAMLALATDYDCWHEEEEDVSVEAVLKVLKDNASRAGKVVARLAALLPETSSCPELSAARYATITSPAARSKEAETRLQALFGKYW